MGRKMYCCWEARNCPSRPSPPSSSSPNLPSHLSCHLTSAVLKNGQLLSIPLISLRLSIPGSPVEHALGQFTSKPPFPTACVSVFRSGSLPFARGLPQAGAEALHRWLSSTRPTPAACSPTSAQQELMSRTNLSAKGHGKLAGKTGVIPVAEGARVGAAHIKRKIPAELPGCVQPRFPAPSLVSCPRDAAGLPALCLGTQT